MTKREIDLASVLLREHLGDIVADVASVMLTNGPCPLKFIIFKTKQKPLYVRRAMVSLMQQQFVTCQTNMRGIEDYTIDLMRVLSILRYPRYIYTGKMLFGNEGEYIVEELLKHGQLTMSGTIQRVVNRMSIALDETSKKESPKKVHDAFRDLVNTRFIQHTQKLAEFDENEMEKRKLRKTREEEMDEEEIEEMKLYELPKIKLNLIIVDKEETEEERDSETGEPSVKRVKKEHPKRKTSDEDKQSDLHLYWRVNVNRFHQYLRDQLVVNAIKTHYDDVKAGEIARIILRLTETKTHRHSDVTAPLMQSAIIREAIKEKVCSTPEQVESYLQLFNQDINNRFVSRVEERGDGWSYCVNILHTLDILVRDCLSSIVQDKYGQKSKRIFRLLLEKKYLQQKQIEEMAMITAKDAKQLAYTLFSENIIKLMHVPRTTDYTPSRTFYLFHVDLIALSKDILTKCYHSVFNAITRRLHETRNNKTLLERKNFIEAAIANLESQQGVQDVEQQIKDLRESFSTHDNEVLEQVKKSLVRLENSELQIDETIFMLQVWLFMTRVNNKDYIHVHPLDRYEF